MQVENVLKEFSTHQEYVDGGYTYSLEDGSAIRRHTSSIVLVLGDYASKAGLIGSCRETLAQELAGKFYSEVTEAETMTLYKFDDGSALGFRKSMLEAVCP